MPKEVTPISLILQMTYQDMVVYSMKQKSESFEKFKEFRNEVEKQTGKSILTLRSDCGGEYLSYEFLD